MARVNECSGCGRVYHAHFDECPFCYVQPFLEAESTDDACPVCGEQHESHCPKCGRDFTDADTYCLQCGHIRAHGRGKKGGY